MSIGPDDDEIVDVGAFERDRPVHEILEPHGFVRHLESHGTRHAVALAGRNLVVGQAAARSIVAPPRSPLGCSRRVAFGSQFLRRAIAVVRVALGDEPFCHRPVTVESLGLKVGRIRPADERPFVPVKTEPSQTVENALHHFR